MRKPRQSVTLPHLVRLLFAPEAIRRLDALSVTYFLGSMIDEDLVHLVRDTLRTLHFANELFHSKRIRIVPEPTGGLQLFEPLSTLTALDTVDISDLADVRYSLKDVLVNMAPSVATVCVKMSAEEYAAEPGSQMALPVPRPGGYDRKLILTLADHLLHEPVKDEEEFNKARQQCDFTSRALMDFGVDTRFIDTKGELLQEIPMHVEFDEAGNPFMVLPRMMAVGPDTDEQRQRREQLNKERRFPIDPVKWREMM